MSNNAFSPSSCAPAPKTCATQPLAKQTTCATHTSLKDASTKVCLTRQCAKETVKCIPTTTIEWHKTCNKHTKTKCEKVPVESEKCLTVKTTKCRKIKKKVPVERVWYEKKCTKCPKVVKKAVVVPCTKTITVASTKIEYRDCTEMVDKIEWVKKCCTEYDSVSDYEEYECEEKISVPTWKLEDKEVKYCEEEISWEGKEVCNEKKVRIHEVVDRKIEACMPVKKLITSTKITCTCNDNPRPACFRANHKMVCNSCKKPRENVEVRPQTPLKPALVKPVVIPVVPRPERKSSASSTSTHHSGKSSSYVARKECRNPYCKVCKPSQYNYGVDVGFRNKRNNSDGDFRPSPYV